MAQQWLSYVGRVARLVGIIGYGGMGGRDAPAISRREVFSNPSFDFTAKFCIIGVPYHEIRTRKSSGD